VAVLKVSVKLSAAAGTISYLPGGGVKPMNLKLRIARTGV
jgi:hypothetical protein